MQIQTMLFALSRQINKQ